MRLPPRDSQGRFRKTRRNPSKHIGFGRLAGVIEREEHRKHPNYSEERIRRIGRGAAAKVYREQLAKRRMTRKRAGFR